jgi:hypothetical protein
MFLLGTILSCCAVSLFVLTLLFSRNPKRTLLKTHTGLGDVLALLIVTFGFTGGISMFLSFQIQSPGLKDYGFAALLVIVLAALVKIFRVGGRLAAYEETARGQIIAGPFPSSEPSGTEQPRYRKAA